MWSLLSVTVCLYTDTECGVRSSKPKVTLVEIWRNNNKHGIRVKADSCSVGALQIEGKWPWWANWPGQDVATRWVTKQKMVERVLELLPAIRCVLVQDRKHSHLNPTWQDVSVLESINAAMKPLADFTDVLSGKKKKKTSQCPQLNLCWNWLKTTFSLLRKATIVDPRYRGSMEEAEALDDVKHQLVQELLDLKEPEKVEKVPVVRAAAQLLLEETSMNFLLLHPPRRRGWVTFFKTEELVRLQVRPRLQFQKECRLMQVPPRRCTWCILGSLDVVVWQSKKISSDGQVGSKVHVHLCNKHQKKCLAQLSTLLLLREPALSHTKSACWYFLLGICHTKVAADLHMACWGTVYVWA